MAHAAATIDPTPRYRYGLTRRPPSLGAVPSGFLPDPSLTPSVAQENGPFRWGYLDYPDRLSPRNVDHYELTFVGVVRDMEPPSAVLVAVISYPNGTYGTITTTGHGHRFTFPSELPDWMSLGFEVICDGVGKRFQFSNTKQGWAEGPFADVAMIVRALGGTVYTCALGLLRIAFDPFEDDFLPSWHVADENGIVVGSFETRDLALRFGLVGAVRTSRALFGEDHTESPVWLPSSEALVTGDVFAELP